MQFCQLPDDILIYLGKYLRPIEWRNLFITAPRFINLTGGWNMVFTQLFADHHQMSIASINLGTAEGWRKLISQIYNLPYISEIGFSFGTQSLDLPITAMSIMINYYENRGAFKGFRQFLRKVTPMVNLSMWAQLLCIIIPQLSDQRAAILGTDPIVDKATGYKIFDKYLDFLQWLHCNKILGPKDHFYYPDVYASYAQELLSKLMIQILISDDVEAVKRIYRRYDSSFIPLHHRSDIDDIPFVDFAFGFYMDGIPHTNSQCGMYLLSLPNTDAQTLIHHLLGSWNPITQQWGKIVLNHPSITESSILKAILDTRNFDDYELWFDNPHECQSRQEFFRLVLLQINLDKLGTDSRWPELIHFLITRGNWHHLQTLITIPSLDVHLLRGNNLQEININLNKVFKEDVHGLRKEDDPHPAIFWPATNDDPNLANYISTANFVFEIIRAKIINSSVIYKN